MPTPPSLWWPGDHRAGDLMSDTAFLRALVATEQAWLDVLVKTGAAPVDAGHDLTGLVGAADLPALAAAAEAGGNPVLPLVALLRERAPDPAATWLHRGLTSQDVVDTAVVLCVREAVACIRRETARQVSALAGLVERHRGTPMVARTLTQHAVPTTFGVKAAGWLHALLDADDGLAELRFPAQLGGAAGTLAGVVELAGVDTARACRTAFPSALDLEAVPSWHTSRSPITRFADAAVSATDAWGRIANDVLVLGRPEIAELTEGSPGGSSTMPQKANPVTAVLVRRAALAAPPLAAALHLAASEQVDERADGAWHVEWQTSALLLRRAVVAAAQTTDLLSGLRVHPERMLARLHEVEGDVRAEQRALAAVGGHEPAATYDGLADDLVDEVLQRAAAHRSRVPVPPPEENA